MSTPWWIIAYVAVTAFLAWIAFGRGLTTLIGGVLADFFLEGPEPMKDRTIRRVAKIALAIATIVFIVGLVFPGLRS
jgi:hypothetical protein